MVTWRRGPDGVAVRPLQDVPAIAKMALTSEDRGRDVIRNFNADGSGSLLPGIQGRTAAEIHSVPAAGDQEDRRSRPAGYDLPFSARRPSKLAAFLVAASPLTA